MRLLDSYPILLIDDELADETAAGRATRALTEQLRADGMPVICAADPGDAQQIIASNNTLSCVLIDSDIHHPSDAAAATATVTEILVDAIRVRNPDLPIFLLADQSGFDTLSTDLLAQTTGYVWKLEDTPAFVAARVQEACHEYLAPLLPPFFNALVEFVQEGRYSWHTPGHSGGTAFLKSPVGAAFHEFFGENTLRSDLSVSVGELGSLLEHTGPVGAAEAEAADTFGADRTMFVTNGTSTANKIVFHASVRAGEVVLVDRNCHKSVMHAIVMTGAIPVYLHPTRNANGIIGPIPPSELDAEHVRARIAAHPLVAAGTDTAALAVITNSTYDGLCYDTQAVLDRLSETSRRVLFDEAWFAYAHFHPLYADRHAMSVTPRDGQAVVFATQSTHKLLTAFSQASMVHLHDPHATVDPGLLEEAFMMHTSTSPQYGIIASLDVAARMMKGEQGTALIDSAVTEAIAFRRELAGVADVTSADDWSFGVWQPGHVTDLDRDAHDAAGWRLRDADDWHGFPPSGDGHALLDPIKVTVLTPGIAPHGGLEDTGIPAALVSRFLDERGIVVEKTGTYSFLVLFSLGITKGKSGTLLTELLEFKRLYDAGAAVAHTLPRLCAEHPGRYEHLTLCELGDELHRALRAGAVTELAGLMYSDLPEPVTTPARAYEQLVGGQVQTLGVDQLAAQVSAAMLVPYPPGIPVVMPGERFGAPDSALIRYLHAAQTFDARFPGFETEIHGVRHDGDRHYRIPCLARTS